jgi:hypothetical protein
MTPEGPDLQRQPAGVDLLGPIFISYRQSDATEHAVRLARTLRATGVPVWHDKTDLPPGDTKRRLREALASGLSGAVLIVTPELCESAVVRDIEVPQLLELETQSAFSFAIASTMGKAGHGDQLDHDAPDRLVGTPPGTLRRLHQYPLLSPEDPANVAHQMALQRMAMQRQLRLDTLTIDLQTRAQPRASTAKAGLVVRFTPPNPGRRPPPRQVWFDLQNFLTALPKLVSESAASTVAVDGGAHLSAAYALGAALPTTASWVLVVKNQRDGEWRSEVGRAAIPIDEESQTLDGPARKVAVFVDLAAGPAPVDTYEEHVRTSPGIYCRTVRLASRARGIIDAEAGGATVADIAQRIRSAAAAAQTNAVALFLRAPFPVAVLLGRALNTLSVDLFEWDDGAEPPIYRPSIRVASGRGDSPIIAITASDDY